MAFLANIFSRKSNDLTEPLYTALVDWARDPWFYANAKVPDTIDGRFDMVALMVSLALIRLEPEGASVQGFGRHLIETFVADMDRSMREIGVGDLSVGKHVQRMAEAFLGRLGAYRTACADGADEAALASAVARNVYRSDTAVAADLAQKVSQILAQLKNLDARDVLAGKIGPLA